MLSAATFSGGYFIFLPWLLEVATRAWVVVHVEMEREQGVGLIASSDSPQLLSLPANSRRPPAWGATHTTASRSSSAQTSPFLCTCRKRQRIEEIIGRKFWFKCVCCRVCV
ncbi:hypothetical protein LXL04_016752 [Taraxacum kok-saghyz]